MTREENPLEPRVLEYKFYAAVWGRCWRCPCPAAAIARSWSDSGAAGRGRQYPPVDSRVNDTGAA